MAALAGRALEHADQGPPPLHERVDRAQIIDEHGLREHVIEDQLAQPALVRLRPRPAREPQPVAQQKLRQPVTRAHQILARVIDATHQITKPLVRFAGHERERQLPGREQPDNPLRVTTIGLHPIARRPGDRPRRDHPQIKTHSRRRSREPEPRQPREPPCFAETVLIGFLFSRVGALLDPSVSQPRSGIRVLLAGCR